MKNLSAIMLFVIFLAAPGIAQTTTVTESKAVAELIAASSTKVVKGAPFSAEGISESVQVLSDGNRIARSTTTKMYRDSEGRFRREGTGNSGNATTSGGFATSYSYGSLFTTYGFQDSISIYDPVEGVRYMLNPTSKSARRFSNQNMFTEGAVIVNGQALSESVKTRIELDKSSVKKIESITVAPKANVVVMGNVAATYSPGKGESLGTKTIEGVQVEGTRSVTTLAANSIGNEKPIEIVYERWYSKELDLIVYSRHYDPRFGEQIYRLTNINRSEPDRSLFTVPADYKIVTETPAKFYTTKTQ